MAEKWVPEDAWNRATATERQKAEIIGGPIDGDIRPIPYAEDRDYITIEGVRYPLRVMRMPKTEDRPERTTLVAIHPGFPQYPL